MKFSDFRKAATAGPFAYAAEQSELLGWMNIAWEDGALPVVVKPERQVDLAAWLVAAAPSVHALVDQHGALLFRGFDLHGAIDMERCVRSLIGEPLGYRENTSPRTVVRGNIRTSTDYPAAESIVLHNEHSYSRIIPGRLFFHCVTPARSGGRTPIADCARVLRRIDPAILRRFKDKGWLYVRNFVAGFGQSWQTVYQCTQRSALETHLRQGDIDWEWLEPEQLRTLIRRPAEARHPRTAERLWLNHILFWNLLSLSEDMQQMMLADFGRSGLPHNTYYGDGAQIEASVLTEIREAYAAERRHFTWQPGDFLVLDNMKVAHGREAYEGPRELLFAMGQPYDQRNSADWRASA